MGDINKMNNYLLMIPGPVQLSRDVLEAFNGQTAAHYGPEWTKIYLETEKNFSKLVNSDGRTFLMPGSGSLGLDTAATTFCRDKRCLILNNGMFGDRLHEIVGKQTNKIKNLRFPLQKPVDPGLVRKELKAGRYDVLLVAQAETSTGVLNPIPEIASAVKDTETLLAVDAVASAGIEKIDMSGWGIDILITGSQKGMECPPGLGIVTVRNEMIEKLKTLPSNGWYTSLQVWCEYYDKWHDWHPFPVTLPTNTILALRKSMEIMVKETPEKRRELYRDVSKRFRKAVTVLGLRPYPEEGDEAHGLTSVSTEGQFNPADLVNCLRENDGIQISGSFGALKESVFRVGHMSREQCKGENLSRVIDGIGRFMEDKGLSPDREEAVQIVSKG